MPETTNMSPEVKPAATVDIQPATAPVNAQPKRRAFWQRRGVWLIATLLLVGIAVFGYHWAFGKAKVHWMTIGRTPETGLPVPSNAGDSATFGSGGVGNPINLDASKTVGRTRQDRRLLAYFEGLRQSAICCACLGKR